MLIDATTTLPDGLHLRVRLPHRSDHAGLLALHARLGVAVDEFELARVLRFDPQRRTVALVTAWVDAAEHLAAYGAIAHGADEPELLVADETLAPGIRETLADALRTRARRAAA